jgi:signal transduction histidine kinase/ActR/RegA family two-component response regulator
MADDKGLQAVAHTPGLQYYAYAELSSDGASLFRWNGRALEPLRATDEELAAWQALAARVPSRAIPCRLQTPAGAGWSLLHQERNQGLCLATCPQSNGHLPAELAPELELVGQLALTALQSRTSRDELARQRHEQERLLRQERLRAQADLIKSFSHDFNNLLGTVLLRAEMGLAEAREEPAQAALAGIHRAAADGARLVQHLVDFSGSRADPDQDLLDLGELVQGLAQELWESLGRGQARGRPAAELQLACAPDLHVLASPRDIREILVSLLANAREAMPDGGKVRVEVKRDRKYAAVRVADAGPGLSPEGAEQALEPFFTTKGREHLGLGLSVVHGIVTRSGGTLTLGKSDLGGLAASFTLPLADLRAVRRELRGKDEDEPEVLRNLNVLVVDDEPGMRETLALSLENLGHRVVQATDGRQTLGLLRYHDGFDVLVLDLVMPEMDGWEVAYFARKLQPEAAVVLLTGWGESINDQNDGRVDAVLAKPVTMRELNQAIARTVLRRRPDRSQPVAATQ